MSMASMSEETAAVVVDLDLYKLNESSCQPRKVCAAVLHMKYWLLVVTMPVLDLDDIVQMQCLSW
jgi:hypothetical protein